MVFLSFGKNADSLFFPYSTIFVVAEEYENFELCDKIRSQHFTLCDSKWGHTFYFVRIY